MPATRRSRPTTSRSGEAMALTGNSWPFVGIAIVVVGAVLAWVLRPWWHGGGPRPAAIGLGLCLGLAALSVYGLVGTALALDPAVAAAPASLDEAAGTL